MLSLFFCRGFSALKGRQSPCTWRLSIISPVTVIGGSSKRRIGRLRISRIRYVECRKVAITRGAWHVQAWFQFPNCLNKRHSGSAYCFLHSFAVPFLPSPLNSIRATRLKSAPIEVHARLQVADLEEGFGGLRTDVEAVFMQAPTVHLEALATQVDAMTPHLDELVRTPPTFLPQPPDSPSLLKSPP